MEDVRWPAEQLEEHRLEVSNRIRNLFWTVSGDYDTEFEPDTEKYVYSKQTPTGEAANTIPLTIIGSRMPSLPLLPLFFYCFYCFF